MVLFEYLVSVKITMPLPSIGEARKVTDMYVEMLPIVGIRI